MQNLNLKRIIVPQAAGASSSHYGATPYQMPIDYGGYQRRKASSKRSLRRRSRFGANKVRSLLQQANTERNFDSTTTARQYSSSPSSAHFISGDLMTAGQTLGTESQLTTATDDLNSLDSIIQIATKSVM